MNIKNISAAGPPKKIEKPSAQEVRQSRKSDNPKRAEDAASVPEGTDRVQISEQAKELQQSQNEYGAAKELLNRLPSARAHVVYEALAKIKAGFYSGDEIVEEAAKKLIDGGELDDLIRF